MRQIAELVGIKPASLYYYFPSKHDILITILSGYTMTFAKYVPDIENIGELARKQSAEDILKDAYVMEHENEEYFHKILKILFKEQYANEEARNFLIDDMLYTSKEYLRKLLENLQALKRLDTGIDIDAAAEIMSRVIFTYAFEASHGILLETQTKRGRRNNMNTLCDFLINALLGVKAHETEDGDQ